ncbi:hypothetical protein ACWGDS_01610 [Streptomyces sp. NPDC055059]|jgi:hypothetical protein|uniref:Uncharacterized protein n=1 Tax=Streptomyces sp. NBC_00119 TaxID=2975659 RepID=A0AAU1U397_9ACTN|nr:MULTISPECIES: hypothetical protein [unclassified Streptomyces]MCX4642306.1 hypothetical protein [Streptomyces sp. NBC_01446]MCX5327247.1 hypothetical protein [Streptomyces sp. NBC_00120]
MSRVFSAHAVPVDGCISGPARDGGDCCYAPDTGLLTQDTGFAPAFDVATAVADYAGWHADNPH